jgi:hypothetical protein
VRPAPERRCPPEALHEICRDELAGDTTNPVRPEVPPGHRGRLVVVRTRSVDPPTPVPFDAGRLDAGRDRRMSDE